MKRKVRNVVVVMGLIMSIGVASVQSFAKQVPYAPECVHNISASNSSMVITGTKTTRDERSLGYYYTTYYTCGACGYVTSTRIWFD